jgi:hypothetical protein
VLESNPLKAHSFSDFTGRMVQIAAGLRTARFVAVGKNGSLPSFRDFQVLFTYVEDERLTKHLQAENFHLNAVKISAASEIIGVWTQFKPDPGYGPHDLATMTEVKLNVKAELKRKVLAEIDAIQGWKDDDPYYHKGEWSHVSLRGYKPDDPNWGVKPSEMSRNWWAEHPEARRLKAADWTVLSKRTPGLMELIGSVKWWTKFDRVRLLRLKTGQLKRHTDITDRDAGTVNGKLCRFHLPLVTHPDVRTYAWNLTGQKLESNWQAWHLYYLDQRKPHAVSNPSTTDRVHLVVDVVADPAVREAVTESFQAQQLELT